MFIVLKITPIDGVFLLSKTHGALVARDKTDVITISVAIICGQQGARCQMGIHGQLMLLEQTGIVPPGAVTTYAGRKGFQ